MEQPHSGRRPFDGPLSQPLPAPCPAGEKRRDHIEADPLAGSIRHRCGAYRQRPPSAVRHCREDHGALRGAPRGQVRLYRGDQVLQGLRRQALRGGRGLYAGDPLSRLSGPQAAPRQDEAGDPPGPGGGAVRLRLLHRGGAALHRRLHRVADRPYPH